MVFIQPIARRFVALAAAVAFNVAFVIALMGVFTAGPASALAQANQDEPIYLDEPESEPVAPVVGRQVLKSLYDDKSPRVDRAIAKLSDERYVNDGKYVEYYPGGQKYVEGTYKMGVFEGEWKYWFPNGQICKTVLFKSGRADGQWEVFTKEGKRIWQKSFLNGKRQGKWTSFYDASEKPRFEVSYDQGKPTGQRIKYYESGQKQQVISFEDGKMHGTMTEWNENGDKLAEAVFEHGKLSGKIVRFDTK